MKIERVETIHLRFEYQHGFTYAGGTCTGRLTSLVRVHANDGSFGIGSAYTHPGLAELIVHQQLAPMLVGRNPTEVERLWGEMYRATRWYGRKGAAMSALGAVDTALWDLRGKQLGQPIYRLLGGDQPKCPVYGSGLLWQELDALAAEATRLIDAGFRRVKMRLGRDPNYDQDAVRAVRKAIGEDHTLIVDGSMRYDLDTARRLAQFLADQNVFWFEEPFEPEALDDYVALRAEVDIPIAAGENEFGLQGFRELVDRGAVDVLQPDASRCGGISEVQRVAQLAEAHQLQVATHSWSDAIAIIANAHVIAAAEYGLTVEMDMTDNPLIGELLEQPIEVRDGELDLGQAPGLGISLNFDTIDRYRLSDPFQIPPGLYSDLMF